MCKALSYNIKGRVMNKSNGLILNTAVWSCVQKDGGCDRHTEEIQRSWNGGAGHQSNSSTCWRWPSPWDTEFMTLSFYPSSPLFSSFIPPFPFCASPSLSCLWLSLFHAKAAMSRRNRFAGLLWSCCYDSSICLSHILLSAAVAPQDALN